MAMRRYSWLTPRSRASRATATSVRARRAGGLDDRHNRSRRAHYRVDLGLSAEIQKFGATDAVLLLRAARARPRARWSTDGTFRAGSSATPQLGMKEQLLSSKSFWTCYQCGECARSCPTKADPSEFMAATRRYAIASYDKTRLARSMYEAPIVATAVAIVHSHLLRLSFLFARRDECRPVPPSGSSSPELVHNTGIISDGDRLSRRARRGGLDGPRRRRGEGVSAKDLAGGQGLARSVPRALVRDRRRVVRPGPLPGRLQGRRAPSARPCPGTAAGPSSTCSSCGASWLLRGNPARLRDRDHGPPRPAPRCRSEASVPQVQVRVLGVGVADIVAEQEVKGHSVVMDEWDDVMCHMEHNVAVPDGL